MTMSFKSKKFRLPLPENPGAAEVVATAYPVTFKLYADDALVHTRSVPSREPFTLPSGFEPNLLQIEVSAAGPVTAVAVAGDIDALKQV